MGKQAKKDSKLKGDQRKHNRATKGNNTRKRGPLWSIRQEKHKDKKSGKEVIKVIETRVPLGVGWNPELLGKKVREQGLPEPFDALHLDWADEMREYATELNDQEGISAKVRRINLPDGWYNYEVVRKVFDGDEEILWSIKSKQNLNFGSAGKFTKKR